MRLPPLHAGMPPPAASRSGRAGVPPPSGPVDRVDREPAPRWPFEGWRGVALAAALAMPLGAAALALWPAALSSEPPAVVRVHEGRSPQPAAPHLETTTAASLAPEATEHVLEEVAAQEGASADLLKAIAWQETGWKHFDSGGKVARRENRDPSGRVTSSDWGLMQINDRFHPEAFPAAREDPRANAAYAARYLRELLRRYGDTEKALIRYNGSPNYGAMILEHVRNRPWRAALLVDSHPEVSRRVLDLDGRLRRAVVNRLNLERRLAEERAGPSRHRVARLEKQLEAYRTQQRALGEQIRALLGGTHPP